MGVWIGNTGQSCCILPNATEADRTRQALIIQTDAPSLVEYELSPMIIDMINRKVRYQ
jgi:hypothetical protein